MRVARLARTAPFAAALLAALATAPAPAAAERPRPRVILKNPCPGPLCGGGSLTPQPAAKGKRIVWLVFDGITLTASNTSDDATTNKSGIVNSATENVPAFALNDLSNTGGLSRQAIIDRTLDELETMFAPYDVDFVKTRPIAGKYSSIVFGGNCPTVAGTSCGGVALLDCGETMPNNITFVFTEGLDYRDLAPTAAQESAHAFGLAHTLDDTEVMYPIIQFGFYPDHFGNSNASCPGDEVQQGSTCGRTTQNSHQVMLEVIGPRGQDVSGPDIAITSHVDGDTVKVGDAIEAEVSDIAGVTKVELLIGNVSIEEKTTGPFSFGFPGGQAAGVVALGIRATDGKANVSTARVDLYLPGGDDTPCENDDQCPDGRECNGEFCVPDNGVAELGETCTGDSAGCASALCGTLDGDMRCTQMCSDTLACPDGFDCRGDGMGYCWPGESGGCLGCQATGARGVPGLIALLGLALVSLRRRRQRGPKR